MLQDKRVDPNKIALIDQVCVIMLLQISVYVQSMFSLCSVYIQCGGFAKLTLHLDYAGIDQMLDYARGREKTTY